MYIFTLLFSLLTGFPLPRASFPLVKVDKALVFITDIDPVHRLNAKDRLGTYGTGTVTH